MSKDVDAIGRLSFASKPHEPPPFVLLREAIAGGASTAAVSALLNPIDVLKTRRYTMRTLRTETVVQLPLARFSSSPMFFLRAYARCAALARCKR
eukprot:5736719-Pleurochrysis_carterae.AAC.3